MVEIKKNSQEIIRVESKEYKGNKFLDCRVYFLDKDTNEYRPTKKGISFNQINTIIHGTTLAANSIIQRKGAKTAFITTSGFRDILEMQYEKRFDQYNLNIKLPQPLVPRNLRFTLKERCLASGKIMLKPKINEIKILAKKLALLKIEAIAIGFLHSYTCLLYTSPSPRDS